MTLTVSDEIVSESDMKMVFRIPASKTTRPSTPPPSLPHSLSLTVLYHLASTLSNDIMISAVGTL